MISIDEAGNSDPVPLSNPDGRIEYRYDENNQLSGLTYPSGDQIDYVRDPISRKVTHLNRNTSLVAQFTYASQLQPATRIEFGNQVVTTRQFDDHDRATDITTGVNLWQEVYSYNIAQNLESIVTTSNLDVGGSQSFGYNVRNQLRGATGEYGRLVYRYDNNNNHTRLKDNGVLTYYQYQTGSSRLISINDANGAVLRDFSYDANGNTTGDGARTLRYDAEGRLDRVLEGGVEIASYTYDPYGRRVSKKTATGELTFRYGKNGQLLEEVDDTGALVRQYIYSEEGELIAYYVAAIDQLLAVHSDFLGAPVFLTDSNKNVVWSAKRKPFGETEVTVNTVEFPLRASNQYFDQETGYHYNGQRYYNPVIERYLRNDPIGLEGGHNTYNFALKNPLKYVDLDGRQAFDPFSAMLSQSKNSGGNDFAVPWYESQAQKDFLTISALTGEAAIEAAPQAAILIATSAPPIRLGTTVGRVVIAGMVAKHAAAKGLSQNGLAFQLKHLNKHLPNTAQSQKLIRKEGAAHVFTDKATLSRVEQAIFQRGQHTGNIRGADRYGLRFDNPIGYRISADGSRIPLHYGEIKVSKGFYHVIPRTGPGG
ncbi:MAG: hypothetical protein JKX81_20060 [Arenicella sp.]|nr:hypothetical protein [Arenicella sp.]